MLSAGLLVPRPASAIPYPVEVRVDDEAELDQAYYDGDLTEDERDRLRELFRHPVDVNTADRDALYDLPGVTFEMADAIVAARAASPGGRFGGVEDLLAVPGLPRDVYDQFLPFVTYRAVVEARDWSAEATVGAVWRTQVQHPDDDLPGIGLAGRTDFLRHGSAGFLVAVRPRLGKVHDAPAGGTLSAQGSELRLDPGAFWLAWDGPRWSVIGGSYRIGFGQRLTIDNSRSQRPHGWTLADDATWSLPEGTVTPQRGFHGIALRARQIDLPVGWLDITVFGSAWPKDLYYTDLQYDRPDGAPYLQDRDGTIDPDTGWRPGIRYPTLPNVLWEVVAGANLGWWHDDRNAVGATGYVSWLHLDPQAENLRLAPSSPYPENRDLFGAAGLDFRAGRGIFDLAGEATVTDRGSPAAVLKGRVTAAQGLEIVPSFRYFSPGYDNPYAHPDADADEYLGNRARDELGGRLQVLYQPHGKVRIRADVDVWHHRHPNTSCDPAETDADAAAFCGDDSTVAARATTDLEALLRVQVNATRHERFAAWATYNDRDVERSGRRLSYAPYSNKDGDYSGGEKISWAVSGGTTRIPRTSVSFQVRHVIEDVYALMTRFDQTWSAWLRLATNLAPGPTLTLRVKYFDGSTVSDPERASNQICDFEERGTTLPSGFPASCRGETYVEATLGLSQKIAMGPGRFTILRLRGAWTRWLDHRGRWTYGSVGDDDPSRDEIGIQGSVTFRF